MSKITGIVIEKLQGQCAQFQNGIEPGHIVDMVHAVVRGFTYMSGRSPDWYKSVDPYIFLSGKNPVDVFLGEGMANHFNNNHDTKYKLEHGYIPPRFTQPYKEYLGRLWMELVIMQKAQASNLSIPITSVA